MQTLHVTATAEQGKIIIDVPQSLNRKKFEITIQELHADNLNENHVRKFLEMPVKERLKILKQFEGKAPYPDVEINKYDVYYQ